MIIVTRSLNKRTEHTESRVDGTVHQAIVYSETVTKLSTMLTNACNESQFRPTQTNMSTLIDKKNSGQTLTF